MMNVEEEIKQIIDQVIELPRRDRTFILELLEHREWGVALEHFCAAVTQERIQITNELYKHIEVVSREMDMWDDIREELKDCSFR
ncbi:MafI family immunity protein [Paenibacillus sp. sgz302251]|uniref:MafI family immunity protein n=1 Tax=Paenibacillus sp. sgz302251 TaxID=3414493 RepID=UPI003C7AEF40